MEGISSGGEQGYREAPGLTTEIGEKCNDSNDSIQNPLGETEYMAKTKTQLYCGQMQGPARQGM